MNPKEGYPKLKNQDTAFENEGKAEEPFVEDEETKEAFHEDGKEEKDGFQKSSEENTEESKEE